MRALLRPLSTHTVYSPIECIVTVFVLATLAYFHILSGIKHSSFFEATQPPALRPAYARLTDGEWVAVTKHDWADAWKRAGDVVDLLSKVCLRVFWCAAYVPIQGSPGPSPRFELTLACVVPSRSVAIAQH